MIAILGGGITGIAAALSLKKQKKDFILIERSARLGGKIQSRKIDGYHMELGPNTVLINHPETKAFLKELGLYERRIEPHPEAIKKRFVLKQGQIEAIPYSFSTLIKSKLVSFGTMTSVLSEAFKSKSDHDDEESLADFSRRRFGKQIYQDLITPFVSGIYAGDPEKMSLKYTMPLLYQAEKEYGSIVKGMPKLIKQKKAAQEDLAMPKQKIFSFKNGLQEMIDEASEKIYDQCVVNTNLIKIQKRNEKYLLHLHQEGREQVIEADQLISTLPAAVLAGKIDFDSSLSEAIGKINYVPAMVSHLAFKADQWKFKRQLFGLLSRKEEAEPWLGILFNSEFFPQQQDHDDVLLTVISGGYRQPDLLDQSDEEILEQLNRSINKIGLAEGKAKFHHIYRWKKAIPQYELGYSAIEKAIKDFEKAHPHFKIAGNYYRGVSVSDCIANGTKLAQEI